MATYIRTCGSTNPFSTGIAKCPITPQYIKALIFTQHGVKLPANLTAETIEAACHADYPNRIYPMTHIAEYAPAGGEVQTSQTGYGPTSVVGYSDTTDQFTLYDSDVQRRASVIKNMNTAFDVYYVDEENVIYGVQDDSNSAEFPLKGFPLTGIGLGGQMFRTSSSAANDILTLYTKDYALYAKSFMSVPAGFNVVDALENSGIRLVEWVKSGDNWVLIDKYTKSDITAYYGETFASKASTVITNASAVSYSDGVLTITLNSGETTPALAKASVLQANGIVGIEQA